jgi:DNA-binding MarR family transcriptional regulator/transcriptional regulator with XRE-family HTH domain
MARTSLAAQAEALADTLDERVSGATEVVLLAVRSGRLAELVLQRALRPLGLDGSQLAVLYALAHTRPEHTLAHGDLCHLLAQTPSGVTRTVRRLEANGLVERLADPADGRATIVALTPEGHRRGAAGLVRMIDAFQDTFTTAGVDDVSELVPALARLVDLLGAGRATTLEEPRRVVSSHNSGGAGAPGDAIGERLRQARTARNLTQRDVAARAGVGAPHLSKIEAGKEQPGRELLLRVAGVLGLDADELLLAAGLLPSWAAARAGLDPAGAAEALRRWAGDAAE